MQSITHIFDGSFTYALGWTLVHSLWQCALIAFALKLTFAVLGPARAQLRCAVGLLALALCWLASAVTFNRYYSAGEQAFSLLASAGLAQIPLTAEPGWAGAVAAAVNRALPGLTTFWALGFGLLSVLYASDYRRAARLAREGVEPLPSPWGARFDGLARQLQLPASAVVKLSHRVTGACVVGHFKPVILLPVGLLTQLSPAEVEALVLHEMAHIKRHDFAINALQCCARAVYFFNPGVHWISRQIDRERENACDDLAVATCGSRHLYASSLTKAAELQLQSRAVLAANSGSFTLLPRIKRLWSMPECTPRSRLPMLTGLGALLLTLGVNVTALELTGVQPPAPAAVETPLAAPAPPAPVAPPAAVVSPKTQAAPRVVAPASPTALDFALRQRPTPSPVEPPAPAPEVDRPASRSFHVAQNQATHHQATQNQATQNQATQNQAGSAASDLEPVASPHFNEVLVSSEAQLPPGRKIFVEDVVAEFSTRWLDRFRSQTPVKLRDAILADYGKAFDRQLRKALKSSGWEVVNKPQPDALLLKPRLFDIFIFEPDASGNKQTLVGLSGQAGMELVVAAPDATPFLKITDHRNTRAADHEPILASRASNFRYFKMLMGDWSQASADYLNAIMAAAQAQSKAG